VTPANSNRLRFVIKGWNKLKTALHSILFFARNCMPRTGAGRMRGQKSLIVELEEAIKSGSQEGRVETLRRVTDLFF
jgi:hypothetical protein